MNMTYPSTRLTSSKETRLALIIVLAFAVHACGFQLRGSLSVSDEIAPVYLQQNSVFELAREIKSLLATNKIKTVNNAAAAKTHLTLVNESKKSRVLSVSGSGQAKEYLLTYTANITIRTYPAKPGPAQVDTTEEDTAQSGLSKAVRDSVVVRRDLVFDSAAVLGFANEADILYEDMRKQAARLILLKLQAHVRNQTTDKAEGDTTDPGLSGTGSSKAGVNDQ